MKPKLTIALCTVESWCKMSKTVIYDSNYFAQQEKLKQAIKSNQDKKQEQQQAILPCPCCGCKALHFDRFERHTIQCGVCGITTTTKNTFESCLEIWNKRKLV